MGKPHSRSGLRRKVVTFYLDECLPYRVAAILKEVGYPVISWDEEFQHQQGFKDPYLIPYMGAKNYVWITKDDSAKKEHENAIRTEQISVVWLSGLERPSNKPKQNFITVKDLHRMLTCELDDIEKTIINSNKPQYFHIGMRSDGKIRKDKVTLEKYFSKIRVTK